MALVKYQDKLADIPALVEAWAQAVDAGRTLDAYSLLQRLVTAPRLQPQGLDALVARCESGAASETLTAAFLRQLCCAPANGRGGRHARKYPVTFGLRLRWWNGNHDSELHVVYHYWKQLLAARRLSVAALATQSALDLLTQARFQVGRVVPNGNTSAVAPYDQWLGQRAVTGCVEDALCLMLDAAHVQTLWVCAQASDATRQVHLQGGVDASFVSQVVRDVRTTWAEAVTGYLQHWTTTDPKKLALESTRRGKTPWVTPEDAQRLKPALLEALQVADPLEPYSAWQRQWVHNGLHRLVDGVFYQGRKNGILGLFPATDRVLCMAWSTTPQPRLDEYAQELWPAALPGQEPAMPRDVMDTLWHATQHYWDYQGEPLPESEGVEGAPYLVAERSREWLPLAWTHDTRQWVQQWVAELPASVRTWCPASDTRPCAAELKSAVPVLPEELLAPSPQDAPPFKQDEDTRGRVMTGDSRDPVQHSHVRTDPARRFVTLEEAVFSTEGRTLVTSMDFWQPGFSQPSRRQLSPSAHAYKSGLDVALQQGLAQWLEQAMTPRGRALLGSLFLQHSPCVLSEPFSYAEHILQPEEADTRALAQWLRSAVVYEFQQDGFAWYVSELLHAAQTTRYNLGREALAHMEHLPVSKNSLTVGHLAALGAHCVVQLATDASFELEAESWATGKDYLREAHLWSRVADDGLVHWSIGVHKRAVIELKAGDAGGNSILRGDGRRERLVDTFLQQSLIPLDPATTLPEAWALARARETTDGSVRGSLTMALELLAKLSVLLESKQLVRETADLQLAPASEPVTLDSVFRRPATEASQETWQSVVMTGWTLKPGPVEPQATAAASAAPEKAGQIAAAGHRTTSTVPKEVFFLSLQARLHLGWVLRQARKKVGLTAKAVAGDVFGLRAAHAAVCRFERGCQESLSAVRLRKLLDFYGLDFDKVLAQCQEGTVAWGLLEAPAALRFKSLREALQLTPEAFVAWTGMSDLSARDVERIEAGALLPDVRIARAVQGKQPSVEASWLLAEAA